MDVLSVGLILFTAVLHVLWNLLVKRASHPQRFTWALQGVGALLVLPFALPFVVGHGLSPAALACALISGAFYAGYYTLMSVSYSRGELSTAYPVARGVAPVAAALWGVAMFGERPSIVGAAGIAAIALAVGLIGWGEARAESSSVTLVGFAAALGTGLCSAGYSVVDKVGLRSMHAVPYLALSYSAGFLMQWPVRRLFGGGRAEGRFTGREVRDLIVASAACSFGYLVVLIVLARSPASYVVPLRASSVLFSLVVARRLLNEGFGRLKVVAACLIVAGVMAIAMA